MIKIAMYLDVPLRELSETASKTNDFFVSLSDGSPLLIESESKEVQKALSGPFKKRLVAYAKKLNELNEMEKHVGADN